ncbi:hypothetical protein PMG11_07356 [Penicillium brasilianum]|uniref:Rho-GAP domain-containing protein n=1 Tax=Penicillium brasilianum TaxID=104259 RepID=A0A0F7TPM3_PENBI|nr:hypothetical protein PMG11_07356 [Penicillium brasilianum]
MTFFQTLFRSRKSEADRRSRLFWPRIRRSQSAAVVLEGYLHRLAGDEDPSHAAQITGEPEVQHQDRQVSGQTVRSQESTHTDITVCRRPSQRISLHLQEPSEEWSVDTSNTIEEYAREGIHIPEVSDPFSDGKIANSSRLDRLSSSRYSEDPLPVISESGRRSHTEDSSHQTSARSYGEYSQRYARRHEVPHSVSLQDRISSLSSQSNCITGMGLLDPVKAREAFNVVAGQFNLPLGILTDEPETANVVQEEPTLEVGGSSRRHRFLGSIRPVKSNLALGKASTAAPSRVPRLQRTKTFADLLRRPEPMTSLHGMSAEKLARLGGSSFITLPFDLAPAPLQLPACIVASVMFLRKYGDHTRAGDLFVDPGDLKEASRLYDSFASQVLSAAKDEHRISSALRVITMPICQDGQTIPVLSAGWTFKALLAGMPGGILGSTVLYETLIRIYLVEDLVGTDIPRAIRTRLIALAIVALTSEMQCSLLCAVFGLLRDLLRTFSIESDQAGKPLRVVASAGLTRVFGPVLNGIGTGAPAGLWRDHENSLVRVASQVKQKIEEELVTGMLLEYWSDINTHLRAWTRVASTGDYMGG